MMFVISLSLQWILFLIGCTNGASVRSYPNFDYEGKTHKEFLQSAIERSSPGNARVLTNLFGGLLELGLDIGSGAQAVISVGGAATRCQHQSPCFDTQCNLCYDPLLRIHGRCGGASYFTCRGTLPKSCLPYTCTATRLGRSVERGSDGSHDDEDTVLVKKFPRFQDVYCLGIEEKARKMEGNSVSRIEGSTNQTNQTEEEKEPKWLLSVPDAVTPCQGFDICLDLRCGTCYDPYLGAHTTCGKLTYYDCNIHLPAECQPMRCTETNINEIFSDRGRQPKSEQLSSPLMVRNFPPLEKDTQLCL